MDKLGSPHVRPNIFLFHVPIVLFHGLNKIGVRMRAPVCVRACVRVRA